MASVEEWRDSIVPGVQVSSRGRVYVVPFTGPMPYGGTRSYGGQTTIGQWDGLRFIYPLRGKTYKVARLVCHAFHGPPPEGKPYCLHINEDARDNRASNLKWGTPKENLNAPGFLAYCRSRTGENNPRVKGRKRS